ncbi:putative Xaa-Pro aminopeptidase [Podospora australis]|uniref:Xaa-Pro aminopeptidase n=1 Tax=Podospora australis TaxID=1536484 RepID=A0AAN6X0U1_9PEZI|nr:putative Xaa-Pro aminopeptidase [Podospora australis]
MEVDHDLVMVDEFDALAIEVKVKRKSVSSNGSSSPTSPMDREKFRMKAMLNDAWLHEKIKYPAKDHAKKVAQKLGVKQGLIFMPGAEEKLYEDSDQGPHFRQRRHFYYMSGADFPGACVTYDIARDHLVLWVPYSDPRTILWYGKTPTVDECKAITDVDDVRYIKGLPRFLFATLSPGSVLYALHGDQVPALDNTKGVVNIDIHSLLPAVNAARVIKSDYEVAMIRRANAVSSAAHKAVMGRLRKLCNEREIDAIFHGFCLAQGAKYQAYPIIAASGKAASTLHYDNNDAPLAGQQLVLLDAGAEWNCYASDVTRTFPLSGKFSPEAKSIYSIVERMQKECIEKIKPGVYFYQLHIHAARVAVEELVKLNILHNGTVQEICERGTAAAFFPHGLGHHVGLEVHDVTGGEPLLVTSSAPSMATSPPLRLSKQRNSWGKSTCKREIVLPDVLAMMFRAGAEQESGRGSQQQQCMGTKRRLEKNMVVTVEPGVYFCKEYIQAYFLDFPQHAKYINKKELDKYWDVGGVRIEDDILVTADGYENLTTAPKGEEMLKIISSGTEGGCQVKK